MRLRIILLVLAISSLILVAFLLPLALLLRTFAADRATSSATAQAQWMAPLGGNAQRQTDLRLTIARVNAQDAREPTTVFMPGGQVLGNPGPGLWPSSSPAARPTVLPSGWPAARRSWSLCRACPRARR